MPGLRRENERPGRDHHGRKPAENGRTATEASFDEEHVEQIQPSLWGTSGIVEHTPAFRADRFERMANRSITETERLTGTPPTGAA